MLEIGNRVARCLVDRSADRTPVIVPVSQSDLGRTYRISRGQDILRLRPIVAIIKDSITRGRIDVDVERSFQHHSELSAGMYFYHFSTPKQYADYCSQPGTTACSFRTSTNSDCRICACPR